MADVYRELAKAAQEVDRRSKKKLEGLVGRHREIDAEQLKLDAEIAAAEHAPTLIADAIRGYQDRNRMTCPFCAGDGRSGVLMHEDIESATAHDKVFICTHGHSLNIPTGF